MGKEIQTRSNSGAIKLHNSFLEALDYADESIDGDSVWKISFNTAGGERISLVRLIAAKPHQGWVLDQMNDAVHRISESRKSIIGQEQSKHNHSIYDTGTHQNCGGCAHKITDDIDTKPIRKHEK